MDQIRWKQRFDNLKEAYTQLEKVLAALKDKPDDEIIHMALVQAYEFTYELSWKTLKDYLNYEGLSEESTPRKIIKAAFAHQIIEDGQLWIDMLEARNMLSHTYNKELSRQAVHDISTKFINGINQVYHYLASQL